MVGTTNGLNRYDGYECVVYKHINGNSLSISGNCIEAIIQDSEDNLWVGTDNGLNRLNSDGTFERFITHHEQNSLSNNYVTEIIDRDEYLFISTRGGGVNRFHKASQKFTHYTPKDNIKKSFSSKRIFRR